MEDLKTSYLRKRRTQLDARWKVAKRGKALKKGYRQEALLAVLGN